MIKTSWIRRSESPFHATEVCFQREAYTPHRHDTYTFAVTCIGVQSFNYRRELRHSLPGQTVVLHPDELHDGYAGTETGFRYRSISVDPQIVCEILGDCPLPHIKGGIATDPKLLHAACRLCAEVDDLLDAMERQDALERLVIRLQALSGGAVSLRPKYDTRAAEEARKFIDDNLFEPIDLNRLSIAADKDRWELSRAFKAVHGTSPYRYITQRRLEASLQMLRDGTSPSETAVACAFFDQSHFIRHFKKAFGITPTKWAALLL